MAQRTSKTEILDSVKNFDSLPDSAHIDLNCLKAYLSKSKATIYRYVELGILPKPRKLGGGATRNFWIAGEVRRALSV